MNDPIDFATAVKMMPAGDRVHTFRQSNNGILIGAEMQRDLLLDLMRLYTVTLSGNIAQSMDHGLILVDHIGPLFIATCPPNDKDQ